MLMALTPVPQVGTELQRSVCSPTAPWTRNPAMTTLLDPDGTGSFVSPPNGTFATPASLTTIGFKPVPIWVSAPGGIIGGVTPQGMSMLLSMLEPPIALWQRLKFREPPLIGMVVGRVEEGGVRVGGGGGGGGWGGGGG